MGLNTNTNPSLSSQESSTHVPVQGTQLYKELLEHVNTIQDVNKNK